MGKSTTERLKRLDVQQEVHNIIEKRRREIEKLLTKTKGGKKIPSPILKPASTFITYFIFYVLVPILTIISFVFIYVLLRLYDTTNIGVSLIAWIIALGIYVALVAYIHSTISPTRTIDLFKVLFSILPLFLIKILFWKWPDMSSPVDNSIGTFYLNNFDGAGFLMNHFKYVPLSEEPFNTIKFPFESLSFDWLFESLNKDNIGSALEGEQSNADDLVTNFYIQTFDGEDIYGYDEFKEDLTNMVMRKRYIGHMVYDFIAAAIGITTSTLWASY